MIGTFTPNQTQRRSWVLVCISDQSTNRVLSPQGISTLLSMLKSRSLFSFLHSISFGAKALKASSLAVAGSRLCSPPSYLHSSGQEPFCQQSGVWKLKPWYETRSLLLYPLFHAQGKLGSRFAQHEKQHLELLAHGEQIPCRPRQSCLHPNGLQGKMHKSQRRCWERRYCSKDRSALPGCHRSGKCDCHLIPTYPTHNATRKGSQQPDRS